MIEEIRTKQEENPVGYEALARAIIINEVETYRLHLRKWIKKSSFNNESDGYYESLMIDDLRWFLEENGYMFFMGILQVENTNGIKIFKLLYKEWEDAQKEIGITLPFPMVFNHLLERADG